MTMGSMVMGSAAMVAGGDGLDGDGRDVDGLNEDRGGWRRGTTAAVDDGSVVADNRQLP